MRKHNFCNPYAVLHLFFPIDVGKPVAVCPDSIEPFVLQARGWTRSAAPVQASVDRLLCDSLLPASR